MTTELIVYVGPTSHGIDLRDTFGEDVRLYPPVRRGDIQELIRSHGPGRVAIVDGTFHSYPSVGHAELRAALEAGWQVWGLCSMGAIRAAEMRHLGMHGYGAVYEQYIANEDFDDDEVTLMHGVDAPFVPLSEPMIHIRTFIADLVARGQLASETGRQITANLKQRWYAERTLYSLKRALVASLELAPHQVDSEMAEFDHFRLKTLDLLGFAAEKPWLTVEKLSTAAR